MWDTGTSEESLHPRTFVAAVVVLLVAVVLQVSVVARLGAPLGRPDLVLVLLAIIALIEGPMLGAVLGFAVGLVADLLSTHVIGQTALVLCLVGYLVGLVMNAAERSIVVPLAAVGAAAALGTLGHAATTSILGDAALTGGQAIVRAIAAGLYALLVTPFLFPLAAAASRRLHGDRRRV
ncbi:MULTISPECIES: rod shape-determining protein MreD [Parafrankia]|uniref:Rod shape-determining protein MreD n=1 Tax=Parafrankia soli TaxID=2599596 RepID=A0A1S1QUG8_9ACTN|nr:MULTISPECIES: rod shape-determining protein MreD [Parafrankia]OHV37246.1 rod shape-determining protein MreD [Parafrankia soli]TCJ36091.1 rod shape-determining protein MreD [Parafrankia sp. BMG5.11]CAI7980271.1 rod shape-determining protein MreD [Frankia sp. Hr75.2]SQD95177.1 putative rod shape-determining protein MreD; membrane protein [Parafrankia sp. Ea1.12]